MSDDALIVLPTVIGSVGWNRVLPDFTSSGGGGLGYARSI